MLLTGITALEPVDLKAAKVVDDLTLHADPRGEREAWLAETRTAIAELLAGPRRVAAA